MIVRDSDKFINGVETRYFVMIKAIIFDIGGVVLDMSRVKHAIMREFDFKDEEQRIVPRKFTPAYLRGEIALNKIYSIGSKRLNRPASEVKRKIFKAYMSMRPINGMYGLLDKLKKSRIKLAVLSNATKPTVAINKKLRRYRWFKPVILSCEVGMKKPDRKIFYLTLKKLRLRPEECIFIDDLKEHVQVARKMGFNAIQFKNTGQLKKDLRKLGVRA
jgi:epoxide hydrolase-like predicted phosphatase